MINFVILKDDEVPKNFYKKIIQTFINDKKIDCNIFDLSIINNDTIDIINNRINGKKIFILDMENSIVDTLKIAKNIRNNGDLCSQIIVLLNDRKYSNIELIKARKVYMLDILYNAAKCDKERLVIEGAEHAVSVEVNPELYWKTIDSFIEKHI